MNRREFVAASAAALSAGALLTRTAYADDFEVHHTEAEWRALLTERQYEILREGDTEVPGTSELLDEKRAGTYSCVGCGLDAFSSKTKFESDTGWPSFWDVLPNTIGKTVDRSHGMTRDAVRCRRCGGHLGHVFDDGPKPTGLRYCINGTILKFTLARS